MYLLFISKTVCISKANYFFERRPAETYIHDNWLDLDVTNRIPPKYEKLSDQFVYWIIDVLLH